MLEKIKGIAFDIDGTLIINNKLTKGAKELLSFLRKKQYSIRFITNKTKLNKEEIANQLYSLSISCKPSDVYTTVDAFVDYASVFLKNKKGLFLVPEQTLNMLTNIPSTDDIPDYILFGDLDEELSYSTLNMIYNHLKNKIPLITFHRNLFYMKNNIQHVDSGIYTKSFEKIFAIQAIVTGKPSPLLFNHCIKSMNLCKENILIVGDDVETDIKGASNLGLLSVLVKTGKYKESANKSYYNNCLEVENLMELLNLIKGKNNEY